MDFPPALQLLLTGEPVLVSGAATLLLTVLQHNAGKLCRLSFLPAVLQHHLRAEVPLDRAAAC